MTDTKETPEYRQGSQKLTVTDRKNLEITGVEDVISFDETGAVIRTSLGVLAVDGENIRVSKLDVSGGDVVIGGKINGMFWSEESGGKGRIKRLLR